MYPAEDIPPESIATEQVARVPALHPRGGKEPRPQACLIGIVGRQPLPEKSQDHEQTNDEELGNGQEPQVVPPEPAPEFALRFDDGGLLHRYRLGVNFRHPLSPDLPPVAWGQ